MMPLLALMEVLRWFAVNDLAKLWLAPTGGLGLADLAKAWLARMEIPGRLGLADSAKP